MANKKRNLDQNAHDRLAQPERLRPSLIEFLSDPAQAVAPEAELDLRPGRGDGAARENKCFTAKDLLSLTSERGAVLTDADSLAIEELKKL